MDKPTIQLGNGKVFTVINAYADDTDIYGSLGDCMSKEEIKKLKNQSYRNVWRWCVVEMKAIFETPCGITIESEPEYLGCCSYASEKDFVENSGYYDDIKETVVKDLEGKLQELLNSLLDLAKSA